MLWFFFSWGEILGQDFFLPAKEERGFGLGGSSWGWCRWGWRDFPPFFPFFFSSLFLSFSSFSSLFSHFFCSFFFEFLLFSYLLGKEQTTATYWENGEFHSDPVCTNPVQNFPIGGKFQRNVRKLHFKFRVSFGNFIQEKGKAKWFWSPFTRHNSAGCPLEVEEDELDTLRSSPNTARDKNITKLTRNDLGNVIFVWQFSTNSARVSLLYTKHM